MAKTDKKPKAKKTSTPILDNTKLPVVTAKFDVDSITMKDLKWSMTMKVKEILDKSYHYYGMSMVFDESTYQDRIELLEQKVESMRKDRSLFPEMDEGKINLKLDEIANIMDERDEKKAHCPTMGCLVEVEKCDWAKGGETALKVRITDAIVPELNTNKAWFSYYKIELEPRIL